MAMKLSLCQVEEFEQVSLALCAVVFEPDKAPPEWIELVPAGADVTAVDGRKFRNPNPQRIIEAFRTLKLDLPVDYEHSTEKKAPKGEEAPAAGWIKDLEVRTGSLWGKVQWTPRGTASLTSREYRYISPAFYHQKDGTIFQLSSAGLTNKPALNQLAAVASASGAIPLTEVNMNPDLLKLLGLDDKATPEQVLAACRALKDSADAKIKVDGELATARAELVKAQTPDLGKFVPRADYEAALARAGSFEKEISDGKAAAHKATVEVEIDAALKAGKITPATKDFYVSTCSTVEGLAKFRDFVKAAANVIVEGTVPDKKPDSEGTSVSDAELAIARNCGLTPEQYADGKKSMAQRK